MKRSWRSVIMRTGKVPKQPWSSGSEPAPGLKASINGQVKRRRKPDKNYKRSRPAPNRGDDPSKWNGSKYQPQDEVEQIARDCGFISFTGYMNSNEAWTVARVRMSEFKFCRMCPEGEPVSVFLHVVSPETLAGNVRSTTSVICEQCRDRIFKIYRTGGYKTACTFVKGRIDRNQHAINERNWKRGQAMKTESGKTAFERVFGDEPEHPEPIPSDPEAGIYERSTRSGYRRLAEYIDSQDETREERLARMRAIAGRSQ